VTDRSSCTHIEIVEKSPDSIIAPCPLCKGAPTWVMSRSGWEALCQECDISVGIDGSDMPKDKTVFGYYDLKLAMIARWNIVCGNDEQREEARMTYAELLEKYSGEKSGDE
jgi:hypothetical protein